MTPKDRQTMRLKRLNRKGQGVANELSDIMAGKDLRMADIPSSGVVGMSKKEQRLRAFLEMINASRQIIVAGEYLEKVADESPRQQLFLDDNPWLEADREPVDGREMNDSE